MTARRWLRWSMHGGACLHVCTDVGERSPVRGAIGAAAVGNLQHRQHARSAWRVGVWHSGGGAQRRGVVLAHGGAPVRACRRLSKPHMARNSQAACRWHCDDHAELACRTCPAMPQAGLGWWEVGDGCLYPPPSKQVPYIHTYAQLPSGECRQAGTHLQEPPQRLRQPLTQLTFTSFVLT